MCKRYEGVDIPYVLHELQATIFARFLCTLGMSSRALVAHLSERGGRWLH